MKAKQKIFNKLRKEKRKIIFFLPVFFGVLFVFMSPFGGTETAHALWPFNGAVDAVVNELMKVLVNVIMFIPAKIAGISAALLNLSVNLTVSGMGDFVKNATGINEAWGALRDVSNIMFIAILIWIGISTILNLPENYTKLLPKLIIIALLINFSLFITKFVVDISNAFSIEILQLIEFEGCDYENPGKECEENGLAGAFIEKMGITSFYNLKNDTGNSLIEGMEDIGKLIVIAVLGAIFLLVVAFIFFAASILLIIRFIVLLFLMILSPLAFAAMVLPKTKQHATKWWNALFNQAFFAPFFFLLIFVTLKIIDGLGQANIGAGAPAKGTLAAAIIGNEVGYMSTVLIFVIIAGLFVASLFIAKEMGIQGSSTMMKWGKSTSKWGAGKVGGFAGRNTIGKISHQLAESKMMKKWDESRIPGGGLVMKNLKSGSDLAFGDKKGYKTRLEDKKKHREESRKRVGKTRISDAVSELSKVEREGLEATIKAREGEGAKITDNKIIDALESTNKDRADAVKDKAKEKAAEREKKFRERYGQSRFSNRTTSRGRVETREAMEEEWRKEQKKKRKGEERKEQKRERSEERKKEIEDEIEEIKRVELPRFKSEDWYRNTIENSQNDTERLLADKELERLRKLKSQKKQAEKKLKEFKRKEQEQKETEQEQEETEDE